MSLHDDLSGACFCGAVQYALRGRVFAARSCHCSRCRKAFSAQASAYAQIEPGALSWTQGEEHLTSYVGKHGAGKVFCSICGSTLCGVFNGEVHGITLGCLNEDPSGLVMQTHIFVDSKAAWEVLPEGIDAHPGPPPSPLG